MTRKTLIATGIAIVFAFLSLPLAAAGPSPSGKTKASSKTAAAKPKAKAAATKPKAAAKKPVVAAGKPKPSKGVNRKPAASRNTAKSVKPASQKRTVKKASSAAKPRKAAVRRTPPRKKVRSRYSPWITPTYADSTVGDKTDGEDLVVRRAAVTALGRLNGSVIVADPSNGRILTMVNQKLALTGAYQPCSTIKLLAGVAAINEGLIDRETRIRLGRRSSMNLTHALATSNNPYFAKLGDQLGFEKVYQYATQFGLGEKAGWEIEGESPGLFPREKPKGLSVGLMTSYGEAIGVTPLQLTAMVSAIANGGTLYYLQYPKDQEEILNLTPRVKRYLDIQAAIPEMRPGMMGAVDFGTARRAMYDMNEPIFGKTGTCTDLQAHLGWFGSFNEVGDRKLVVIVLLTGGRPVNGPVASGVAGQVYKLLSEQQYYVQASQAASEPAAISNAAPSEENNLNR